MENKKVTKRMVYGEMVKIFEEMGRADLVKFAENEITLLDKKASAKKSTKKDNEEIKALVLDTLATLDNPITITDLLNISALSEYRYTDGKETNKVLTNSKISAVMKALKEEGKVIRTEEKRKAYFSIVK